MLMSLPERPSPIRTIRLGVERRLRALRFRMERARLVTRISELRDLVDVPHDLAEAARARIDRLSRRERALSRLMDEATHS